MMQTRFMKCAVMGAAAALALLAAGVAQATLQDRDLDGDLVIDAFYDTDLDVTWLRNANVAGAMNWAAAVAWADGFSFGGYSDWRLPTSDTCIGSNCIGSEMGHLWYVELGNPAGGPMSNIGNFQNVQFRPYWSGLEYAPGSSSAWYFNANSGSQNAQPKSSGLYVMAVRPGDVPAIPEPQTYALMLIGLSALLPALRRQPR